MSSISLIPNASFSPAAINFNNNSVSEKLYSLYYEIGAMSIQGRSEKLIGQLRQSLNLLVRINFSIKDQSEAFLIVYKSVNALEYLGIIIDEAGDLNNDHIACLENQAEYLMNSLSELKKKEELEIPWRSVA